MIVKKMLIIFLSLIGVAVSRAVSAVCPVCVVAVGAGLGLSRWLGIDDVISGIWIGAIIMATALWTIDFFNKKNWKFKYSQATIILAYYILIVLPLYYYEIIGIPHNVFLGIDKILFGIILGTIIFLAGVFANNFLKKKNNNKVYFPYQKVVFPLGFLTLASVMLYFII